jgi:hypothetical protein
VSETNLTGVREEPSGGEIVRLWIGLLGPPVIWLADLAISYALVSSVCKSGNSWILDLITILALLLTVLTTFIAWREWNKIGQRDAGETVRGRRTLMALGGLTNGAFFILVIVATAIPNIVLRSCP